MIRWIFGLPGAALVTALLFAWMAGLIGKRPDIAPAVDPPALKITPERKPPPAPPSPPRYPSDQAPPAPERPQPSKPDGVKGVPFDQVKPPTGPGEIGKPRSGATILTAPPYPEACRARGAQGVVVVAFDVSPEGQVVNARIVSTPDSCFNRDVLRAVAKWKFPPDYDGDRPVMRRNVQQSLVFQLEE